MLPFAGGYAQQPSWVIHNWNIFRALIDWLDDPTPTLEQLAAQGVPTVDDDF